MSWVPPEAHFETRIQVQVVNLGGDLRKCLEGSGEVSQGREGGPRRMLFGAGLHWGPAHTSELSHSH